MHDEERDYVAIIDHELDLARGAAIKAAELLRRPGGHRPAIQTAPSEALAWTALGRLHALIAATEAGRAANDQAANDRASFMGALTDEVDG